MDLISTVTQRTKSISTVAMTESIIIDVSYIDDSSLPPFCAGCPKAGECVPKDFHRNSAVSAFKKNDCIDYRCQEGRYFFATPVSQTPVNMSLETGSNRFYSVLTYVPGSQPKGEQRRAVRTLLSDAVKSAFMDVTHDFTIMAESNSDTVHPGFGYLIKQEEKILSLISTHDTEHVKEAIGSYIGYILTIYEQDISVTRSRISELIVLAGRACISAGADAGQILELTYAYLNNISIMADVQSMHNLMIRAVENFSSFFDTYKDTYHVQTIQRIKEYVNDNYYKKISLEEISELVHLSKSHLSRVINNGLGSTLCNYVNSVRIEKSFGFLTDPWLNLSDVAKLCGFDGQSYFTKVFKLHTGVSPGRYREMNMKNLK